MRILKFISVSIIMATPMIAEVAIAQTDPGVRSSTGVNAGNPLPDLATTSGGPEFFANGLTRFQEIETVSGGANVGLGPRFNFNQCSGCHSQPAIGGSSPSAAVFPDIGANPQSEVITNGIVSSSSNTIPSFVTATGPVLEARFPFVISGATLTTTPDGGVHDLFTVQGRSDATGCGISQPNFNVAADRSDIVFRIPTPVFGAGFMENIGDNTLIANFVTNSSNSVGVAGTFNHNGNDGTISRFGWKAQNKSLLLFAGEAYNVEMGITNELFPNERPDPSEETGLIGLPTDCINLAKVGYPEDTTNFAATTGSDQFATNASIPSDIVMFAMFMRLLNQPIAEPGGFSTSTTTVAAASITRGSTAFKSVGCSVCHTSSLTTDASAFNEDLSAKAANLFSDLEVHHMGGLADNVSQGTAGGDQFRSAPLWGVGQRIFFLHDGRTSSLLTAIQDHCIAPTGSTTTASEACTVVSNFEALPATTPSGTTTTSQQDVLNFLRSL